MPSANASTVNHWVSSVYGWACKRLYHEFAWAYDTAAWGVSGGAWDRWRRTALEYVRGPRVLELGMGTGHLALAGDRQGLRWIGLDLSSQMLAQAVRRSNNAADPAMLVQAHAEHVPFANHSIDTVVATFPAPFILSSKTLQECRRVLEGTQARLVIVGLWVQPNWAQRLPVPVLYGGPSETLLRHVSDSMCRAGFAVPAVHTVETAGAKIGVLVAQPAGES